MSPDYLHGTDPEEQRRLSRLNELLNQDSLRMLDLRGDERILDVGSGLGQLSRAMARAAGPDGVVVGVECSLDQLVDATRQAREAGEESLVEFRHGDAAAPPLNPDEWGTFDVVHARFVLELVQEPEAVVRAMVRAARPGESVPITVSVVDGFGSTGIPFSAEVSLSVQRKGLELPDSIFNLLKILIS